METKQRTLLLNYLHIDKETKDLQKEFKSPHFVSFFLNFLHSKSHQLFELNNKVNVKSQDVEKLATKPSTANQKHVERISTPKALTSSPQTSYNDGSQQHRDHINRSAHSGKKKNRKPLNRSRQENSNDGHRNLKIDSKTPVFGDYLTKTTKPSVFDCTEQMKEVSLLKTSKSFDVSNSEDFPSLSSATPQLKTDETKKSKRRIKPTLVSSSVSSEKCKLVFDSVPSLVPPSGSNGKLPNTAKELQEEKEILLKTRIFNAEKSISNVKIAASLDKQLECISPIQACATIPLQPDVTPIQQPHTTVTNSYIVEMKRFASLFAHLIAQFLVPSIMEELHLVVMLLTLDPSLEGNVEVNRDQPEDELSHLLRTTNEGFIFATEAILHLTHTSIIEVFNKEMLQLLHSAIQAKEQCNELLMKLTSMIKTRSNAKIFQKKTLNFGAVEFKLDADERSNFVSDKSFQGFKKQRDLFYEIMEEWRVGGEPSHKDTTRKVHWLVTQVKNLSTYEPFIRLFLDNLILAGNKKLPPKRDTPHPSLVTGDPERLRLLESRVTTPTQPRMTSSHGWLSTELQFFREFVKTSDSFSLNLHLLHGIKERIVAMETNMDTMDYDHNRNLINITHITSEELHQTIFNLRILGNFYGFVVFLPFLDSVGPPTSPISQDFITSRIHHSTNHHQTVMTIPWVVQYLSYATQYVPGNTGIRDIFHQVAKVSRYGSWIPPRLRLYLVTIVGSLFEGGLVNLFYDVIMHPILNHNTRNPTTSLDLISDITDEMIMTSHWRMNEISTILKTRLISKRSFPKKIKPSSEKLPEKTDVQFQLEEFFFRNQPSSLKRIVTFVSERCHSNCVKHTCQSLLPEFCDKSDKIAKFVAAKEIHKDESKTIAHELYEDCLSSIKNEVSVFISMNVRKSISALLHTSTPTQVVETSCLISERQVTNTALQWLNERLFDHLVAKIKSSRTTKTKESKEFETFNFSSLISHARQVILANQSETKLLLLADDVTMVDDVINFDDIIASLNQDDCDVIKLLTT